MQVGFGWRTNTTFVLGALTIALIVIVNRDYGLTRTNEGVFATQRHTSPDASEKKYDGDHAYRVSVDKDRHGVIRKIEQTDRSAATGEITRSEYWIVYDRNKVDIVNFKNDDPQVLYLIEKYQKAGGE